MYVSRATEASDASSLDDILEKSHVNNPRVGVSGVLCAGRGYFVQALEGMEDDVLSLYAHVMKDVRHQQVSLLSIGLVAERAFSKWGMAYVDGNDISPELHARLVRQTMVSSDVSASGKLLQSVLRSLRRS